MRGSAEGERADQRDDQAGERRGPDRLRPGVRPPKSRRGSGRRVKKTRQSAMSLQRAGAAAAASCAQPLAMAWKKVPVTLPRRPPEAPSGLPWPSARSAKRRVGAGVGHLRIVEFVAAHRRCRPRPSGPVGAQRACAVAEVHLALGEAGRMAEQAEHRVASRRRRPPALRPSTMKPPHSPWTGLRLGEASHAGAEIRRPRRAGRHAVPG